MEPPSSDAEALRHQETSQVRATHRLLRRVHEYTDLRHKRRQLPDNVCRHFDLHVARTRLVKHEPERIGSGLHGGKRVLDIRDATDFDFDAHAFSAARWHRGPQPPRLPWSAPYLFSARSAAVLGSSNVSTPKTLAHAQTGCARGRAHSAKQVLGA